MKYCAPRLIDMGSIGVRAFGQCQNGSTANSPSCFDGGSGVNTFESCTPGSIAAGYDKDCSTGANPTTVDACSSGTVANPHERCATGPAVS